MEIIKWITEWLIHWQLFIQFSTFNFQNTEINYSFHNLKFNLENCFGKFLESIDRSINQSIRLKFDMISDMSGSLCVTELIRRVWVIINFTQRNYIVFMTCNELINRIFAFLLSVNTLGSKRSEKCFEFFQIVCT